MTCRRGGELPLHAPTLRATWRQRRAGKPRCSSAADCQLAAVISTVTGTTRSAPIIPIIGGSMSIIAPVHDRACGCLVAVEGSSRAPEVHARYCGLWAAASTSESVHKVRQILAHRPMNRGGAFLAECGEGSHSPPRPAASRWEFFGVAVPISLDVRLRQAVRQQLGPPPHAPGTLCRALSSRTVSRCSRGVRAVPRPVPPSVLARGHLPLGGAPFCGVASLRVRVRPLHRGQPLRGSPVARSESRAQPTQAWRTRTCN